MIRFSPFCQPSSKYTTLEILAHVTACPCTMTWTWYVSSEESWHSYAVDENGDEDAALGRFASFRANPCRIDGVDGPERHKAGDAVEFRFGSFKPIVARGDGMAPEDPQTVRFESFRDSMCLRPVVRSPTEKDVVSHL